MGMHIKVRRKKRNKNTHLVLIEIGMGVNSPIFTSTFIVLAFYLTISPEFNLKPSFNASSNAFLVASLT
jgi:hypothetical protein